MQEALGWIPSPENHLQRKQCLDSSSLVGSNKGVGPGSLKAGESERVNTVNHSRIFICRASCKMECASTQGALSVLQGWKLER